LRGDVYVGVVPAEPGLTNAEHINASGDHVKGFNTVQSEMQEGLVIFDIVFYVRMRDGLSQIIINVEAQKDEPSGYDILNRAVFYVSRLVSSQKEREFTGKNFNDLKRVYSIWICMNMDECIWDYVHLTDDSILGDHKWKGKLDLLNIVLLGIPNKLPKRGEQYELHRLLGALFSNQLTSNERIDILENEYHIAAEMEFREEMDVMCNLSEGIYEQGRTEGKAEVAFNLRAMGMDDSEIAQALNVDVEIVKGWFENESV